VNLSLISCGAVTPGGFGAEAALSDWPSREVQSEGGLSVRAGLVKQEAAELVRWQKEPRLRRASPISYFMIEATEQALSACPDVDRNRVGIVATFFLGCLVYSVRFYRQITNEGRRFSSPVLFPETVFNSPLSHVVSTLKIGGPVYSQIGDKTCWLSALRTAQCWLAGGQCDHVIVLGAEEFEPHEVDAFHAGGLLRAGLNPCEGAIALLCGRQQIKRPSIGDIADGFSFRSRQDATRAASACLDQFPADWPLLDTAKGWTRRTAASVNRNFVGGCPDANEGFTMSAAADTLRAVQWVDREEAEGIVVPVWGLTNFVGAYRVAA
jgi:hypothetical protein